MPWRERTIFGSNGLDTSTDEGLLEDRLSPDCQNVEFDRGTIKKRFGSRKVNKQAFARGGLHFDGTSGWGLAVSDSDFDISATLSIELTCRIDTFATGTEEQILLSRADLSQSANSRFSFIISQAESGGNPVFRIHYTVGGAESLITSSLTLSLATTYKIVVTIKDGEQNLFVWEDSDEDGAVGSDQTPGRMLTTDSNTDSGAILTPTAAVIAGAIGVDSDGRVDFTNTPTLNSVSTTLMPLAAKLDEVRIWNADLADDSANTPNASVTTYLDRELDTSHEDASGIRGYWKLNDRSGVTGTDSHPDIRGSGTAHTLFLEPRRVRYIDGLLPDEQGYALRFDGYDDRGIIPIDDDVSGTGSTTAAINGGYTALFCNDAVTGDPDAPETRRPNWCFEVVWRPLALPASGATVPIIEWLESQNTANTTDDVIFLLEMVNTAGTTTYRASTSTSTQAGTADEPLTTSSTTAAVVGTTVTLSVTRRSDGTGSELTLFLDGVQESQATGTAGSEFGPVIDPAVPTNGKAGDITVGFGINTGASIFANGDVDEMRLWWVDDTAGGGAAARGSTFILRYFDKPLPLKEIIAPSDSVLPSARTPNGAPILLGYWRFDENSLDYNDAPLDAGELANIFPNVATADDGQTINTSTTTIAGGLSMLLFPGSHLPEWTPGLLRGAVQGGLMDLVRTFKKSDGTQQFVAIGEGAIRTVDDANFPTDLTDRLTSGFQGGNQASAIILNDRLYMTNGLSPPQKWDGTNLFRWGLAGPTRQAVFSRGGDDSGGGFVAYTYTYVSRISGIESNPAPPSAVALDVTGGNGLSINVFPSVDPQVDTIRIYRTTHGSTQGDPIPGSSVFQFVDELTNDPDSVALVNYNDGVGDLRLGDPLETRQGGFTSGPPPWTRFAAAFNDRIWLANDPRDDTTRNQVFYSEVLEAEEFGNLNFIQLESGEGEPITGLAALFDRLFVFKRTSIYAISGFSPENFQAQIILNNVGTFSHFSIIQVDGWLYFLSDRGPMRFNGTSIEWIGEPIHDTFQSLIKSNFATATAGHNKDRQQIWFSMPTSSSSTSNDVVLVYDYSRQTWSIFRGIFPQCFDSSVDNSGINRIFWGDDFGFIWRGDASATYNDCDLGLTGNTEGTIDATGTNGSFVTFDETGGSSFHVATGDRWKGARVQVVNTTTGAEVAEGRILFNNATRITTDFATALATGQTYRIGAVEGFYETPALAFQRPNRLTRLHETEVEGRWSLDNNASQSSKTTMVATLGRATEYGSTFTDSDQTVTVGGNGTTIESALRFNQNARAKRIKLRVRNDRPHEGFEIRTMTLSHTESERV